jgi:phosphomethylpyrimidine synthase
MPPESPLVFSAYAASQKLSEAEALQKGMEAKAVEFVKQGAEVYKKL